MKTISNECNLRKGRVFQLKGMWLSLKNNIDQKFDEFQAKKTPRHAFKKSLLHINQLNKKIPRIGTISMHRAEQLWLA